MRYRQMEFFSAAEHSYQHKNRGRSTSLNSAFPLSMRCAILVIRNQQIEALSRISSDRFTEDMVSHVKTHFPNQYKIAGELAVRQALPTVPRFMS